MLYSELFLLLKNIILGQGYQPNSYPPTMPPYGPQGYGPPNPNAPQVYHQGIFIYHTIYVLNIQQLTVAQPITVSCHIREYAEPIKKYMYLIRLKCYLGYPPPPANQPMYPHSQNAMYPQNAPPPMNYYGAPNPGKSQTMFVIHFKNVVDEELETIKLFYL